MAFSRTQIISLALGLMGKAGINVIGNDPLTAQADAVFDLLLPANMQKMSCRFATTSVQLSLTPEVPVSPNWSYIYAMPGDFLKLVGLDPVPLTYEIYGNKIYTNYSGGSPLYLEYVRPVMPEQLSPVFVQFFVTEIAMWLAASNAQNANLTSFFRDQAQIYRAEASAIDAQNRPSIPMQSSPVVEIRSVGFGANFNNNVRIF